MQRDDACNCKAGTIARCKAPWRWPNLAVQRDDPCNFKIGTTVWCKNTVLVEILRRSAKMFALQDVQDCAVRGAVLAKNLAMQHDDA